MSEQNNDNLEKFFRERAQYHDLEFNEGDWQQLKAKLDKEMPVAFSLRSFLKKYWYALALLLIIPISWMSYTTYFSVSNETNTDQSVSLENYRPESGENEFDINKNTKGKTNDVINMEKPINTTDEAGSPSKNREYSTQILDQSFAEGNYIAKSKTELTKNMVYNDVNHKNIGYAVSEDGAESLRHNKDSKLHFLLAITPESKISKIPSQQAIQSESINEISNPKSKILSFYAGIGYSPDFSTVGIGNFVAPGTRWTAILELGFKNRLMLHTGFIWVNNKYEAYGEDYHAPVRYWQNGIVADEAYGECVMIDVPLNLRYNVLKLNRHQLFISGGASTYFLLKEDYWFHYEQDDPDLPKHWGTEDMSVYPFGIINFSIGYQYALGRKGSLQVEPFIKIPTAGVGWGEVDLHTMGAYFMYKHRIGK